MSEVEKNITNPINLPSVSMEDFASHPGWFSSMLGFADKGETFNLYNSHSEYLAFSVKKETLNGRDIYTFVGKLKVPPKKINGRVCTLHLTVEVPEDQMQPITAAGMYFNQAVEEYPKNERTDVRNFFPFAIGYSQYLCQEAATYFNRIVIQREGTPLETLEAELVNRGFTPSELIQGSQAAELEKVYHPKN